MKSLVVGGGGDIGRALCERLAADGDVTVISSRAGADNHHHQTDYSTNDLNRIVRSLPKHFDTIFICNGFLHDSEHRPEKRFKDVDDAALSQSLERNLVTPTRILQQLVTQLDRKRPARIAVLTARVGSIEDNQTGGWYSYRTAKAAMNMMVRSLAIELKRTHPELILIALHPGTTRSALSEPFLRTGRHPAVSPGETASRLVAVVTDLAPEQSGQFLDWRGEQLPF